MKNRFLSLLCVLALCLGLLPVTALAAGEHDSHSNNWMEFTAGTTTLSGGSYYLSGDVEYSGTEITVSGEVILCLNGHKLDLNKQHISVGSGASLTLCDCSTGGVLTGGSGSNGGGVYVGGGGTFTMTGGSIAGNTANAGGGVYVDEGGTFTMEDGSINNNQATSGGGGGVMVNKGSFTLSGGSITGNTTNSDTFGYGGGVCLYGTFYLSGDSIIQNNTKADATDNLYLGWNTIKITGPLGENAHIGVTAEGVPRTFISEWSDNMAGEDPADYFSSDGDSWSIGLNTAGEAVLGSPCTTITLNPNGGTLPEYPLVAGAALPIPTKTGYTFAGWYENPEFSGNPVTDIPTNSTEKLTFYAKWTVNTYTISANVTPEGAGTVTVNGDTSATVVAGTKVTLSATANSGYRFTGWTFSDNITGADSSSANTNFIMPAGDVTVTANFEKMVTSVSLNKNTLELYTGQSETLIATVTPDDATNKAVTWASSNTEVATVDNSGTVTAKAAGEATITVTTADGNYTAACTVKVNDPVYNMTINPTTLDFGSVYTGYTQPAAQTVTITNSGNQPLTLTQPAYTSSFVVGPLSTTSLPVNGTATFTVQPKAGLSVGTYSENIMVSGSEGATVTIPASFTVEQRDNTPYYGITVNAPANGTVTCYAKSAAKGAEVTLTVKPDVGYALDKLTVTDASGKTVDVTKVDEKTYTFVMPGRAVTVEAVFAPSTSGLPFTDVSAGDWFYEAVQFVYENGLMDGVGNNLFAPNATLNRAMAVTILYRLEGSPDLDGENLGYPFADVDGDTWYSDAVYWARCNGIVDGVENNHFNPTGSLTREQMATVLYRYAQYKGADVSASGDISGFADSANVSSWAVDAVKWAVGTGLVNGVEGNALAPQGTSTRAQAAAVLMRLSQAMGV